MNVTHSVQEVFGLQTKGCKSAHLKLTEHIMQHSDSPSLCPGVHYLSFYGEQLNNS